MSFRETMPDKILNLLKAAFGNRFHYFYGDPIYLAQTQLPALIVEKQRTALTGEAPLGMERLEHTIMVKVAYNKKDDFNRKEGEIPAQRALEEIAEAIDETTGEFATQSVAGVLRRNYTLVNSATGQEVEINYGVVTRPEDMLTAEAEVSCTVEELLTLTGRT